MSTVKFSFVKYFCTTILVQKYLMKVTTWRCSQWYFCIDGLVNPKVYVIEFEQYSYVATIEWQQQHLHYHSVCNLCHLCDAE